MFWFKNIKHTSVDVVGIKHRGRVRKNNEDYYEIIVPDEDKNITETILLLADGMGGYKKGEVASKVAIKSFKDYFFQHKQEKKLSQKVYNAIQYSNLKVFELSKTHPDFEGMGTTLAVLVIYSDYAVIGNVGDSRVYMLDDKNLIQISEEHSYVNEIGLSPEQARNHPNKNIITRSIGKKNKVQPYVNTVIVKEGISFLLCSDGLTTHVTDRFIRKALISDNTIKEKVNTLLREALNNGGTDNISIILAVPRKVKKTALTKPKKRKIGVGVKLLITILIIGLAVSFIIISKGYNPMQWFSKMPADSTSKKQTEQSAIFIERNGIKGTKGTIPAPKLGEEQGQTSSQPQK